MSGISFYPNSGYNYTSPYLAVSTAAGSAVSGNASTNGAEESKPVVNPGESMKVSPGRKSSRPNARPARNANIRTALTKWFPSNRLPIFHRRPPLQLYAPMNRSTSATLTRRHPRAAVRSSAPMYPLSGLSVRNVAEAMFRVVRLPRRFPIRMSRPILMPKTKNQQMHLY